MSDGLTVGPKSRAMFVAALCLSACAKHPVDVLERQAKGYDRQADREKAASLTDDRYFMPVADAEAVAAADLARGGPLSEVSAEQIGTDWAYGGTVGVDQSGEYFDQLRSRNTVKISPSGPEVQVYKSLIQGQRRIGVKGKPTAWSDTSSPVDATSLRSSLGSLEVQHLAATRAKAKTASVLADFEGALPPGYSISERSETGLVATTIATTRKENKRKGLWATWEARTTLTAAVNPEGRAITVTERGDHRFTTEAGVGAWLPAAESSQAAAMDWLAASLRIGMPAGHEAFGNSLVAAVTAQTGTLSAPPDAPRLRNMDEIAVAVRARAFETGTGNFTVCLDTVLVNPTDESGYDWDLPGVSDALAATTTVSQAADGALGQLNAVADELPMVGSMVDGVLMSASSGAVDRKRAQLIAQVTGAAAGWTSAHLPVKPDVAGTATVGASGFNLSQTENSLRMDPNACATTDYSRGGTAVQVSLWDVDLTYNDPIGACAVSLDTVVNQGVSGVPCGWARLYVSATYNFSFDQIAIVGLPPAQ